MQSSRTQTPQFLPLICSEKQLNPKVARLIGSTRNRFSLVTCVGSRSFYTYTRQMLLHMNIETASIFEDSSQQEQTLPQKSSDLIEIDVISPRHTNGHENELETSFAARANSDDARARNILGATDIEEIESEYELSKNQFEESQCFRKDKEIPKNLQSKTRTRNLIHRRNDTQSQIEKECEPNSAPEPPTTNREEDRFSREVEHFKQEVDRKKRQKLQSKFSDRERVGATGSLSRNQLLRFYSSKQIGSDKQKKPIEWIYCEAHNESIESLRLAYLLSSTVVYELKTAVGSSEFDGECVCDQKSFERALTEFFRQHRRIFNEIKELIPSGCEEQLFPDVLLVCSIPETVNSEETKANFSSIFGRVQSEFMGVKCRAMSMFEQSPHAQFQLSHSPNKSRSKIPPTPKRMPLTLKLEAQNTEQSHDKVRLEFRFVSEELSKSGVLRENYSRMREITSQGRHVFNCLEPKSISGNIVSPPCFVELLEEMVKEKRACTAQRFSEVWGQIFERHVSTNIDEAVRLYEQKVSDLMTGKSMVSQQKLGQIHEAAKKQTLRQFSQKKIGNSRVLIQSNKTIKSNLKIPSLRAIITKSRKESISNRLSPSSPSSPSIPNLRQISSRESNHSNDGEQFEEESVLNLVESRIDLLKNEIQERNKQSSVQWLGAFLDKEYSLIEKKISLKEVKTLTTFQQELQFLREVFRKKLETYTANEFELMDLFENFIFQKIFEGVFELIKYENAEWEEVVKSQKEKTLQIEGDLKQFKKTVSNRERLLNEQSQEKQSIIQKLRAEIQTLNRQMLLLEESKKCQSDRLELQISQREKEFGMKLKEMQEAVQRTRESHKKTENDYLQMKSKLEKQQCLHRQTREHYEHYDQINKNNVNHLEEKLKEQKALAKNLQQKIEAQEEAKQQQKPPEDPEESFLKSQKVIELSHELIEHKNMLNEVEIKVLELEEKMLSEKRQHESEREELQLQKQLVEEKLIELESRLPRYRAAEASLKKVESEREQLSEKLSDASKQRALLEQSVKHHQESISQAEEKASNNLRQLWAARDQNEQLKALVQRPKELRSVQTDLSLKEVARLNEKCRSCQQNVGKLQTALKLVESLNQNYAEIKEEYMKSKTRGRTAK